MRYRRFKLTSFLLAIVMTFGAIAGLSDQMVFASAQDSDAAIEITAQNLQNATVLSSPYNIGVNLEMSMISDEMWIDNGRWMEQVFSSMLRFIIPAGRIKRCIIRPRRHSKLPAQNLYKKAVFKSRRDVKIFVLQFETFKADTQKRQR